MSAFTLATATVKTKYDDFLTAQAATVAAQAVITGLGARPTYPVVVTSDAAWNNVTTAQATYDASLATAQATLTAAQATQRAKELLVIASLGYQTGATSGICADEWVKVIGAGGGVLTYTNYIGYATNSTYLTVSTTLPSQNFPLI